MYSVVQRGADREVQCGTENEVQGRQMDAFSGRWCSDHKMTCRKKNWQWSKLGGRLCVQPDLAMVKAQIKSFPDKMYIHHELLKKSDVTITRDEAGQEISVGHIVRFERTIREV